MIEYKDAVSLPTCVQPAKYANIPVRLLNTMEPTANSLATSCIGVLLKRKLPFAEGQHFDNLISGEHDNKSLDAVLQAVEYTSCLLYTSLGETVAQEDMSWIYIFITGFVVGLLALFTPCVWPIIPMTVSFFLKRSKDKKKGIRDAWGR